MAQPRARIVWWGRGLSLLAVFVLCVLAPLHAIAQIQAALPGGSSVVDPLAASICRVDTHNTDQSSGDLGKPCDACRLVQQASPLIPISLPDLEGSKALCWGGLAEREALLRVIPTRNASSAPPDPTGPPHA
ncbi:hypothetical protein FHS85_001110 [Rhodoligotrophos appendicifer]|uniref:hypothetical protein n=1 Tax=Rhodoligotrophos appendicifer TaxID=987056 RepID=UPI001186C492|nr:hypothetical protein [Rhodoligotrophos appendicifer]